MKFQDIQYKASDIAAKYMNEQGYKIIPTNVNFLNNKGVIFLGKGTDRIAVAIQTAYTLGESPNNIAIRVYKFTVKRTDCPVEEYSFSWDSEENRIENHIFYALSRNWFTEDVCEYDNAQRIAAGRHVCRMTLARTFTATGTYLEKVRGMYGFKTAKNVTVTRTQNGYVISNDKNDRTHKVNFDPYHVGRAKYAYQRHAIRR